MSADATVPDVKFSPVEETLYGMFRLNVDVQIAALYEAVSSPAGTAVPESGITFRQQQQAVGKYISRINAKIQVRREVIVPGKARRTYALRKLRGK